MMKLKTHYNTKAKQQLPCSKTAFHNSNLAKKRHISEPPGTEFKFYCEQQIRNKPRTHPETKNKPQQTSQTTQQLRKTPLTLRKTFRITKGEKPIFEVFLKITGWTSEYPSVNNLLMHLKYRKTCSEGSRRSYCENLHNFCVQQQKTPDQLITLPKETIQTMIENYCYQKMDKTWHSNGTANITITTLKTFFKVNGYKGNNLLDLELFRMSSRERVRPQYIPTLAEAQKMAEVAGNLRNQAIIHFLYSTGLRNATLCALQYKDIKQELENGYPNLTIKVTKEMKNIVNGACKGKIEYYTFTSQDATEALKRYLNDRQRKHGPIQDDHILFNTEYNQITLNTRPKTPLTHRELQLIVKNAAFKAGLKEWKNVYPHCLRKTFDSILRSQQNDGGRLDFKTQEYLMGHILPGSADTYFGGDLNLALSKVEELRREYAKLVFKPQGNIDIASLRGIAETFGIDINHLEENKKKELGRPPNDTEKLNLIKQAIFQLRNNLKNTVETENAPSTENNQTQAYNPIPSTKTVLPAPQPRHASTPKQNRNHPAQKTQTHNFIELTITTEKQRQYALFPLNQDQRKFFPGYKTPFTLQTDIGKITTSVTSGKQTDQTGDPEAGKYIMGGLRPWFREHTTATKVRFTCIKPHKQYQLTVLPEAVIYA